MFERAAKLEKVFRRHPGAPVFARLAEHALRKGCLMRARVLCEEGREQFPDYPTGHVILGRVYEMQGLWEDARAAFDQGLRLDPDQPAVYRRLSRVYQELGNPTLALKCLESAARLDPLSDSIAGQLAALAKRTRQASTTIAPVDPPSPAAPAPLPGAHGAPETSGESVPKVTAEPFLPAAEVGEEEEILAELDIFVGTQDVAAEEPFSTVQSLPEWEPSPPESPAPGVETPEVKPAAEVPSPHFEVAQPPPDAEPVPLPSDKGLDSSEVAALGEGLFEGDEEEPDAPQAPSQNKQIVAVEPVLPLTPEVARAAQETHKRKSPPPVAPVPPAEFLPETPPTTTRSPVLSVADEVADAVEKLAPEPIEGDLVQTAGFALRGDGGLRDLVDHIQGPEDAQTGNETEPSPLATVTLAQLYNRQGFSERAAQTYEQILAADPSNQSARAGLESLDTTS
jgi:tetratricopeptide (TPR) repeat protein